MAQCFFFSSRRRHTRSKRDWSSDVCSSDLTVQSESLEQRHRQCSARGVLRLGVPRLHGRPQHLLQRRSEQIGRASCRERVKIAEEEKGVKKKKRVSEKNKS